MACQSSFLHLVHEIPDSSSSELDFRTPCAASTLVCSFTVPLLALFFAPVPRQVLNFQSSVEDHPGCFHSRQIQNGWHWAASLISSTSGISLQLSNGEEACLLSRAPSAMPHGVGRSVASCRSRCLALGRVRIIDYLGRVRLKIVARFLFVECASQLLHVASLRKSPNHLHMAEHVILGPPWLNSSAGFSDREFHIFTAPAEEDFAIHKFGDRMLQAFEASENMNMFLGNVTELKALQKKSVRNPHAELTSGPPQTLPCSP